MATFTKKEYSDYKNQYILGCASGDFPHLAKVDSLRSLGGTYAKSDFDLDMLKVDIKTKHFKKRLSKKKARALLAELKSIEPAAKSDYAKNMLSGLQEYVGCCEALSKRKTIIGSICGVMCAVLLCCAVGGIVWMDKTGMLYGTNSICFTADGQEYTQYDVVKYNNYVQLSSMPTKKGYDATGIIDTKTNTMMFDATGKSLSTVSKKDLSDYANCALEVTYEPHEYSAKIMTAKSVALASVTYTVEDDPEDIFDEAQHLDGYVFDGWFTDAKYKKPFSGDFMDYTDVNQPLVLYPHYSLDGWSLTWELNGGSFRGDVPDAYTILSDVRLPDRDMISREGYELIGWFMNGKLIDYFTPTIMTDTTLTAVWETISYAIHYELNGGELYDAENSYTVEDEFLISEPVRKAYRFEGWYLNKTFTKPITALEIGTTGDKTLYAKWMPITYAISYELNGGENSPLNPYTYTAENDVQLFAPKRKGYQFKGWYKTNPADLKEGLIASEDASVNLTALWEANEYIITINPNNDSATYTQSVKYDDGYTLSQPTRKGYSFKGFTMGSDIIDSVGLYQFTMDISVLANYTANTYNIAYISDGITISTQEVTYGKSYSLSIPEAKANYEFVGWYDKQVGGSKVGDGVFNNDHDMAVYALWQKVLTINLESDSEYTIDNTIEKVYIIGNYTGTNELMKNVSIKVSARDYVLTIELHNAGFKGKANSTAIDCENSSYTLKIIIVGTSRIEGGNGTNGADGVSGSKMTADNRNGKNGGDGGHALNSGRVIFESTNKSSKLTLQGGSGGNGGNGGVDKDRCRMWLNYTPDGGNGGSSQSALNCIAYSINGTTVTFEQGSAGAKGKAGSRGDWWCAACYGSDGKAGTQRDAISYK